MPEFKKSNPISPSLWIPVSILLLGIGLRLHELGRTLGGADENAMLLYFGYSPFEFIATHYFDANNHIFHTLLVHLMAVLFGEDNAVALRLPTFLFGIASLWMIFLVARKLFQDRSTAWLAMLIAAVHPVHIHYSQTARGYSLIMFFSITMIYATLRLLETRKNTVWGAVLVLCGFLSVYTLPTNVYFLLGLGAWVFSILLIPRWARDYGLNDADRRGKFRLFFILATLTAALCTLVYLPLMDQVVETARQHPLLTFDTESTAVVKLVPAILEKIFPNPLGVFLPFLIAGVFARGTGRAVDRQLFPFVFLLPLVMALFSGVGGYPRNYLFNLPLFVIFLAAGLVWAGHWITARLNRQNAQPFVFACLAGTCVLITLKITWLDYYPSVRIPDGNRYKQEVQKHTAPRDLIVIADTQHYLYARTVFKENLFRIISENDLTGVKLIVPDRFSFDSFNLPTPRGRFTLFKNSIQRNKLDSQDVSGGKTLLNLTGARSISALPEDFELQADWKKISGNGEIIKESAQKTTGKGSLRVRASPEQDLIIHTKLPEPISLNKPSLMILTWAQKSMADENVVYHPAISTPLNLGGKLQTIQFLLGTINEGMGIRLKEPGGGLNPHHWSVISSLGMVPPGTYRFSIGLKFNAGVSVFYDSFRLFFIELDEDAVNIPL